MAFRKLTYFVIVISMLKRTCQSESLTAPCKSVLVNGAERCGCDGVYNITTLITLKWSKGKPVYQNDDKKTFHVLQQSLLWLGIEYSEGFTKLYVFLCIKTQFKWTHNGCLAADKKQI